MQLIDEHLHTLELIRCLTKIMSHSFPEAAHPLPELTQKLDSSLVIRLLGS